MDPAVVSQAALGIAFVHLLETLKNRAWFPWVNQHSAQLNRIISIVMALVFAVGVKITVEDGGGWASGWHGAFIIPSLPNILDGLTHFSIQYGGQQAYYGVMQVVKATETK